MKIRCSSLPLIMVNPRSKGEVLSETAKTEIKKIAKQDFFGYEMQLDTKPIKKGIMCEQDSIELLSRVRFEDYKKNTVRKSNDFLTGEPDIVTTDLVLDVKTSWSIETFPALAEDINLKDYEMQLRGYMMLFDKPQAELVYCMVSTPDELLTDWDNLQIHKVDRIAESKRITSIIIERDEAIELEIKMRCENAIKFYAEYIEQLNGK